MKRAVIWGAGSVGSSPVFKEILSMEYEVVAYCDRDINKNGQRINDLQVLSPAEIKGMCEDNAVDIIVIGVAESQTAKEIKKDIENLILPFVTIELLEYDHGGALEQRYLNKAISELRFNWNIDFAGQAEIWVKAIMSEVEFWIDKAAKAGAVNHHDYIARLNNNKFVPSWGEELREIEHQLLGKEKPIVLDIGCGLAPRYGNVLSNMTTITVEHVDPLAHFYNTINFKFAPDKENLYCCKFGLFEFIAGYYSENYCDAIVISNALDHCIDPYKAILESLFILKEGGTMLLRHSIAEGVRGKYSGLHQWNLDCKENNEFIIWNYANAVNISEKLSPIADVRVECIDRNMIVEIIKRKAFSLKDFIDVREEKRHMAFLINTLMAFIAEPGVNDMFYKLLEQ